MGILWGGFGTAGADQGLTHNKGDLLEGLCTSCASSVCTARAVCPGGGCLWMETPRFGWASHPPPSRQLCSSEPPSQSPLAVPGVGEEGRGLGDVGMGRGAPCYFQVIGIP